MKNVLPQRILIWSLSAWLAASVCLAGAEIQTYTIPKEHPVVPATDIEVHSAPIYWKLPAGWTQLAPTGVRIGNFLVPGPDGRQAEVAITSFPGSVGTELDNVNRWRREIGLDAIERRDVSSENISVDANDGKLYDIAGAAARTVVASVPRNGATWFFKLRGDAGVVAEAKPAFYQFLKSIHFGNNATSAPAAGVLGFTAPDPHAGLALDAGDSSNNEPKWNVPSNWMASQPSQMVLKSFTVSNAKGRRASIAVSTFPGAVGGVFANVNRWRGQLALAPIAENELPTVTQPLDVSGKTVLVDFTGTDVRTSKPVRMVAVIVTRDDSTWFYKLIGDESVVDREKPAFLNFVQTARYQ